MIKICYIGFPQYELDYKWMNYFADQPNKYKVICLTYDIENTEYHFISKNIKVFPVLHSYFPIKNLPLRNKIIKKARAVVKEQEIDIVHCLYAFPTSIWALEIGHRPFVVSTRGSDVMLQFDKFSDGTSFIEKIENKILRKMYIKSFEKANKLSSTSHAQRDKLYELCSIQGQIEIVRTGIDIPFWMRAIEKTNRKTKSYFESKWNGEQATVINIFSSRTNGPLYNSNLIVEAFHLLKKKYTSIEFRMVMINYFNNEYDEELIQKVKELELDQHIRFVGVQDYDGMLDLYINSDITISIPNSDGTPNSVLESMLLKKPCVIGPLDYDQDIFNDRTIWKMESFTIGSLVEQLEMIIFINKDDYLEKMSFAHKNTKEIIALEKQINKIEAVYNEVLD